MQTLLASSLAALATLPSGTKIGGVELAGLDLVGLGIVCVLVVLGLARGLWWQLIRLAGIVAAVVVARTFGAEGAQWISERWPEVSPRVAHGGAWVVLFLGSMAVATLLGMIGHRLLEALHLGLANRLGGGLMGAATGLLLHLALVVGLCQLAPSSFVETTVAGTYSERLYEVAGERWKGLLNPVAAAEVKRLLVGEEAPSGSGSGATVPSRLVDQDENGGGGSSVR